MLELLIQVIYSKCIRYYLTHVACFPSVLAINVIIISLMVLNMLVSFTFLLGENVKTETLVASLIFCCCFLQPKAGLFKFVTACMEGCQSVKAIGFKKDILNSIPNSRIQIKIKVKWIVCFLIHTEINNLPQALRQRLSRKEKQVPIADGHLAQCQIAGYCQEARLKLGQLSIKLHKIEYIDISSKNINSQ